MNRALRNFFYIPSFFLFFGIFFLWTLPYEALKNRVIYQAEDVLNRTFGFNYRIRAGELSFGLFTGLDFDKVQGASAANEEVQLKVDRFRINPSLLSLLFGKTKSSFQLKSGKGIIEGMLIDDSNQTSIELEADNYNLGFAKSLTGISMEGLINGEMSYKINKKNNSETNGRLKLEVKNAKVLDLNIPLDLSNPSSALHINELKIAQDKGSILEMNLKGSSLDLVQLNLNGEDLNLNLKGKILAGKTVADSNLSLEGKFKVSPEVVKTVPFFVLIEPQKNPDGSYDLALEGKLLTNPMPILTIGKFRDILSHFGGPPNSP
ncbi:MAG: type II secretion system protein GspN [Deltaproteobacteria bacterium]|nr:type II secretion system protein GspN [Deltaproteobacteria bacterium]